MKFIQRRRQAFTLIELMAVIIIVGVISTITISAINTSVKSSKNKLYIEQVDRIESGVKKWALENTTRLPLDASGVVFFSVETLKDEEIVDSAAIVDPRTDKELKGCVTIKFDHAYHQYEYEYLDSDCTLVSNIYKPVITITGGENQMVEVNEEYKIPLATSVDYTGTNLKVSGPIIKKGTEIQTSIDFSTVGDIYTLTYQATDERLGLTETKEITLNVVDTIAPTIVVNDTTIGYTMTLEGDSLFEIPTALVSDNSCGESGIEITSNGCDVTLTPFITSSVLPNIPGHYDITYRAEDSSSNVKFFVVTVIIGDSTAPTTPTFAIKHDSSGGENYDESWTNTDVWIGDLSTIDSGSGIDKYQYAVDCDGTWIDVTTKTYSTDVDEQICFRVVDNVGNYSAPTRLVTIKVDKTAPVCTTSGGNESWTNGSRTIIGTCASDTGSGCNASIIASQIYTSEMNTTAAGTGAEVIEDNAGNTTICDANQTVRIDKTSPTCSASSGGNATWTNGSKVITGTCSDLGGSGCTASTISTIYSTEINTNTASAGTGTLTDNAGNSASVTCPDDQTVKIDKTNPSCTSSGGDTSWTNADITLIGTCSDLGGSGCTGNASQLFDSEINTTIASPGSVSDNAGNSIVCPNNQTVKIDKIGPSCASSGGSATWTNTSRTLTGTCSDTGGSGCTSTTIAQSFSSDTNTTTASPGSVTDTAGNTGACPANQTVKIDKTNPTCVSSGGSATWTNTSRTLTGTCSDSGSGCTSTTITQSFSSDTNTTTASPGSVTDLTGNTGACPANQTIKIDKTNPTCVSSGGSTTCALTRTITGTCSDAGSGCVTNSTATYNTTQNTTISAPNVSDNAGNTSATCLPSQNINVSVGTPTIAYVSSTGIGTTSQTVNISYTAVGCASISDIQYRERSTGTIYSFGSVSTALIFNTPRDTADMQIRVMDLLGRYSSWITKIDVTVIAGPSCSIGYKDCNGTCILNAATCCSSGYKDCYGTCITNVTVCQLPTCPIGQKYCSCGCKANFLICDDVCGIAG